MLSGATCKYSGRVCKCHSVLQQRGIRAELQKLQEGVLEMDAWSKCNRMLKDGYSMIEVRIKPPSKCCQILKLPKAHLTALPGMLALQIQRQHHAAVVMKIVISTSHALLVHIKHNVTAVA